MRRNVGRRFDRARWSYHPPGGTYRKNDPPGSRVGPDPPIPDPLPPHGLCAARAFSIESICALNRASRAKYATRCGSVIRLSSAFDPSARTESRAGRTGLIKSCVLQFVSSSTESIFIRCSGAIPMSSYMRIRADMRCGFLDMTRSAENPRTPATSSAPSKNMSACCLERCMRFSLVSQNEAKRIVPRFLGRVLNRCRFHGRASDWRWLEQLFVCGGGVGLMGAKHPDACRHYEDGCGDECGPGPPIELGPPPELDFGHPRHDA